MRKEQHSVAGKNGARLEEFDGSAKVVKATFVARRTLTYDVERWLTAFTTDTTMALVEGGTWLAPKEFDMGNVGLGPMEEVKWLHV